MRSENEVKKMLKLYKNQSSHVLPAKTYLSGWVEALEWVLGGSFPGICGIPTYKVKEVQE